MNVFLTKWIMYFEIHKMHLEGHFVSQISKYLVANRRTVSKYLSMSEQNYEEFLIKQSDRSKQLLPYESFVKTKLELYQDTPSAQMHVWLKEHHSDFPKVTTRTVFNFIWWVREKYNIPKISPVREFSMVEELPYGKQAQVDFGEYNLRGSSGNSVKVYFFTIVLSRSRYKYIWFSETPYTSELAIRAHEQGFEYLGGIPDEIVYDQDKVFITKENSGDIILTDAFRAYTSERSFKLHFCHKSDPQSKGKIENVVKYVKQNFLYNRTYYSIETLNDDALGWLGRTANALPHSFITKKPCAELIIERPFLNPYIVFLYRPKPVAYTTRKDNSISWKSNLYSLPLGTYKGRGSQVLVALEQDCLVISDLQGKELCRHITSSGKGLKIINTDHKRDKSAGIDEMIEQVCVLLDNPLMGKQWIDSIRNIKPRYIRDQILLFKDSIEGADRDMVNKTLTFCQKNKIFSAVDFKTMMSRYKVENETKGKIVYLNPLNGSIPKAALIQPDKSTIEDYNILLNKQ